MDNLLKIIGVIFQTNGIKLNEQKKKLNQTGYLFHSSALIPEF
jgi:hypothetical protein